MRINHNLAALNTFNWLLKNNIFANSALEKLSSGLRINKAGDDPAGLAISEKMRAQIKGLDQAVRNAQDGISLIQTVEGALNETTSILQRMRELSVQAGNNTATYEDKVKIQSEMDKLAREISRISETTKFNGQSLIAKDKTFNGRLQIGANAGQSLLVQLKPMDAQTLGVGFLADKAEFGTPSFVGKSGSYTGGSPIEPELNFNEWKTATDFKPFSISFGITKEGEESVKAKAEVGITYLHKGEKVTVIKEIEAKQEGEDAVFEIDSANFQGFITKAGEKITIEAGAADEGSKGVFNVELEKDDKEIRGVSILYSDKALFDSEGRYDPAGDALTIIDKALNAVSSQRSDLGSYTNRLEHTIGNLETAVENMTASESRIRDVDMASQMMQFTRMSVMSQAAMAMLAQANSQPKMVLRMLRG